MRVSRDELRLISHETFYYSNITRLEEWCKSHDMPEGTLQLEHLMQATKLLQLKKASLADIEIIYDVCWMLTPTQIQSECRDAT